MLEKKVSITFDPEIVNWFFPRQKKNIVRVVVEMTLLFAYVVHDLCTGKQNYGTGKKKGNDCCSSDRW
jgi:hypothetical protein